VKEDVVAQSEEKSVEGAAGCGCGVVDVVAVDVDVDVDVCHSHLDADIHLGIARLRAWEMHKEKVVRGVWNLPDPWRKITDALWSPLGGVETTLRGRPACTAVREKRRGREGEKRERERVWEWERDWRGEEERSIVSGKGLLTWAIVQTE
jgi:hypothetical protein